MSDFYPKKRIWYDSGRIVQYFGLDVRVPESWQAELIQPNVLIKRHLLNPALVFLKPGLNVDLFLA
jgi:hypothetical protein